MYPTALPITRRGWVCLGVSLLLVSVGATAEQMAHIQSDADVLTNVLYAQVKCGGRITIDSLSATMPGASTSSVYLPYYPSDSEPNSGTDYVTYDTRTISASLGRLVEDTLSTSMTSIILFEVDASGVAADGVCDVYWDPRSSWMFGGISLSSITLSTIESAWMGVNSSSCLATKFNFSNIDGQVSVDSPAQVLSDQASNPLQLSAKVTALNERVVGSTFEADNVFPVTILAPGGCTLTYALIASHHGKFTSMGKWLPLVIYSGLFLPVMLIRGRRHIRQGSYLGHLSICLAFIGFAGCCAGLSIELASWHYPLRPFPFPGGVTMFLCSAVVYALVLLGLMYRHPIGSVATFSVMHMLLYGISMGLLVGYFFRQLLVIGCIAIAMIVLTNLMMIVLAARFTASMPNSFRSHTGASSLGSVLTWFPLTAPVMPVSHLALQVTWSGIPAYHENLREGVTLDGGRDDVEQLESQMEVANLHSISSSVLLIVLHHTSTLALLLAACIYHAPFVVALFPVLVVMVLHGAYTAQEYSKAWRRWGKVSLWVSLDTALRQYARHESELTPPPGSRYTTNNHTINTMTDEEYHHGHSPPGDNYRPSGGGSGYPHQQPPANRWAGEENGDEGRGGGSPRASSPPLEQQHQQYRVAPLSQNDAPPAGSSSRRGPSPAPSLQQSEAVRLPAAPLHNHKPPTFRTVATAVVASNRVGGSSSRRSSSQQVTDDVIRAREAAFLRRLEGGQ